MQEGHGKTKFGIKMAGNNRHLSILTILNGLNAPIKRPIIESWVKKQHPTIYSLQETHLTEKKQLA
jgi:hypothetical protein